jgi:hypothetical protein
MQKKNNLFKADKVGFGLGTVLPGTLTECVG